VAPCWPARSGPSPRRRALDCIVRRITKAVACGWFDVSGLKKRRKTNREKNQYPVGPCVNWRKPNSVGCHPEAFQNARGG